MLLGLLVWLSCAWFGSWEFNPNNATRLFAAISLVEDGDATVDEFAALTIDKARLGGHVYLDKAPGMTLMALPAVWVTDRATGDSAHLHWPAMDDDGFARFLRLRLRLAAVSGPALLTAVAAALLYDLGVALTGSATAALFAGLGYALGTPIWGWSTTIFGHATVAALYVVAVWGIWRASPRGAALAGAALGWAVVVEYQAVLAGAVLGGWALARWWPLAGRWRLIAAAALAGIAALLPLLAYNLAAFGTPFRLGYQGVVGFEGMNHGLFGLGVPDPAVLWEVVFGVRRGMIWVAPVLVAAPLGLVALAGPRGNRGLALAAGGAAAVVLLVNAAYVYWDGGNSTGPRHAIDVGRAARAGAGAVLGEPRQPHERASPPRRCSPYRCPVEPRHRLGRDPRGSGIPLSAVERRAAAPLPRRRPAHLTQRVARLVGVGEAGALGGGGAAARGRVGEAGQPRRLSPRTRCQM